METIPLLGHISTANVAQEDLSEAVEDLMEAPEDLSTYLKDFSESYVFATSLLLLRKNSRFSEEPSNSQKTFWFVKLPHKHAFRKEFWTTVWFLSCMCVWIMCKFLPSWFPIGIDRDEWYWHCWKEGCGMIIIPLITSILNPFYRLSWPRKPTVDCDVWQYNSTYCTLAGRFGLWFVVLACNPCAEEVQPYCSPYNVLCCRQVCWWWPNHVHIHVGVCGHA